MNDLQCFVVAILAFMVGGFMRGWRRELISLLGVLLAVVIVRPETSKGLLQFLARIPAMFSYLTTGSASVTAQSLVPADTAMTPVWSLVIFVGIVVLGYFAGNKLFPAPGTPHDRFFGIIPAVASGAFVMAFLRNYFSITNGRPSITVPLQAPDPFSFFPVIFLIVLLAVIAALIAARAKKASSGPAKK
ncbi:MAG: hypothetical protein IMW89_11345 [Ktedonobacteraceae bacterium]|nr:hypothetical protein [Ktedonobacteraceae bacterium]